ncbi:MAG: patatin-like phospholipase family protein [Candidatus Bipolaricaulota bacterium]|nr:patatin-like phospholipase family protein [Candidatus Bipolaricaulota bacterium]MDW8141068.1 patatin-like phospholipase family protein [Candidatus Bipolaricaulota bacterium]
MRPIVGLALGGGGARGYAHIGVIRTLLDHQIPIDVIAGTSMGAAIGVAYACGVDLLKFQRIMQHLDVNRLLGVPDSTLRGIESLAGQAASEYLFKRADWRSHEPERLKQLYQFLKLFTGERNFEDLALPCAVIACDVDTGEEVVLRSGKVYRAVAASMAFPGINPPVHHEGRFLVDGGLVNKVPVDAAVALGAGVVIAVDVGAGLNPHVSTSIEVMIQSQAIISRELTRLKLQMMRERLGERLVIVRPSVERVRMNQLRELEFPIREGERAMLEQIETVKALVAAGSSATVCVK